MKLMATFVVWCAINLILVAAGGIVNAEPPKEAMIAYLDGLEALEKAQWTDATTAFSRALEGDGANAKFLLAHGVASVLAEQFTPAEADLKRVMRLTNDYNQEAKLWLLASYQVSGRVNYGGLSCKKDCIDSNEIQKLNAGPGSNANVCYYGTVNGLGRARDLRDSPESRSRAENFERQDRKLKHSHLTDNCGNHTFPDWTDQSARAGAMFAARAKSGSQGASTPEPGRRLRR